MRNLLSVLLLSIALNAKAATTPAFRVNPGGEFTIQSTASATNLTFTNMSGTYGEDINFYLPETGLGKSWNIYDSDGNFLGLIDQASFSLSWPQVTLGASTLLQVNGQTSFTRSGIGGYSIETSSGILMAQGGLTFNDGSVQYKAASTDTPATSTAAYLKRDIPNNVTYQAMSSTISLSVSEGSRVQGCANYNLTSSGGVGSFYSRLLIDGTIMAPEIHSISSPYSHKICPGVLADGSYVDCNFCIMSSTLASGNHDFVLEGRLGTSGGDTYINNLEQVDYLSIFEIK